jgi:hypothetical protein
MGNAPAKKALPLSVTDIHVGSHVTTLPAGDIVPVQTLADIGSAVVGAFTSIKPGVSELGLRMLPPVWVEIIKLAAMTERPSMMMALINTAKSSTRSGAAEEAETGERKAEVEEGAAVQFLENFATNAELKEMGATPLDEGWLDSDTRRRWGLHLLTPGSHILYSGAFTLGYVTHHAVYLGFIDKASVNSPAMRQFLQQILSSLHSGDISGCIKAHQADFLRMNKRMMRGGGRLVDGVDLVVETSANNITQTRIHVMSLKQFASYGGRLGGSGFIMRDSRADMASVDAQGIPMWMHRALCAIGKVDYKINANNCEHLANFVTTGIGESVQHDMLEGSRAKGLLRRVPGVAFGITLGYARAKLKKRIDDAVPKRTVDNPIQTVLASASTRDPAPLTTAEDIV